MFTWNFASECRRIGTIDLEPTSAEIDISRPRKVATEDKRRLWVRLDIEVGIDITISVFWKPNGNRVKKGDTDRCSATMTLENPALSRQTLINEFHVPV
jgi:hypothetical protein